MEAAVASLFWLTLGCGSGPLRLFFYLTRFPPFLQIHPGLVQSWALFLIDSTCLIGQKCGNTILWVVKLYLYIYIHRCTRTM